jgi:hypothetical protein
MSRSEEFLLYKSVTMNKQKLNPIEQMPLRKKIQWGQIIREYAFSDIAQRKLRWVESGVNQWFGRLIFIYLF